MESFQRCTGFQWDRGNAKKNWIRHQVSQSECEQVIFNRPFIVHEDWQHSFSEDRFFALGQTDSKRRLMVVFTFRDEQIRVISARDMTTREEREFEHAAIEETEADSDV